MDKFDKFYLKIFQYSISPDPYIEVSHIKKMIQDDEATFYEFVKESFQTSHEFVEELATCLFQIYPDAFAEYIKKYGEDTLNNKLNFWFSVVNETSEEHYYDYYRDYKDYLKYNYISWNPVKEDDPNLTYPQYLDKIKNGDS